MGDGGGGLWSRFRYAGSVGVGIDGDGEREEKDTEGRVGLLINIVGRFVECVRMEVLYILD